MDTALLSKSEQILAEVKEIYTVEDKEGIKYGLVKVGEFVNTLEEYLSTDRARQRQKSSEPPPKIYPPSKFLTVMLIGNHSSGKSTFINWYVGATPEVQKVGEAATTSAFHFVQHGKARKSYDKEAALELYPVLYDKLFKRTNPKTGKKTFPDIEKYFYVEIVPERNRSFPVVDFVDTPGMTDEKSDYHFEVEDVILEMAQHKADLILVFLDPRGQAFCQRTIETAAKLFQIVPEKVKVFLSRADECKSDNDLQQCLVQMSTALTVKVTKLGHSLPTTFGIPALYKPDPSNTTTRANAIHAVCEDIDKQVDRKVQRNIEHFKTDHALLVERIKEIDAKDKQASKARLVNGLSSALIFQVILFTLLLAFTDLFKAQVQDLFGFHKDACAATDVPLQTMTSMACFLFKFSAVVGATNLFYTAAVGVLTLVIFRFAAGNQKVLNADQRKKLRNVQQYLEKTLAERKGTIIEDLRSESVNTDDR